MLETYITLKKNEKILEEQIVKVEAERTSIDAELKKHFDGELYKERCSLDVQLAALRERLRETLNFVTELVGCMTFDERRALVQHKIREAGLDTELRFSESEE